MTTTNSFFQPERRDHQRRSEDKAIADLYNTFSTPYCHSCLERMAKSVLLLDMEAHVIYATPQAHQILQREETPISFSPKFTLHHPQQAVRFAAFINGKKHIASPLILLLEIKNGEDHMLLNCFAFPKSANPNNNAARYMITLCDSADYPTQNWLMFINEFNLTPVEGRLCQTLMNGLTLKDYCEKWNVATSTARSQLHSVFGKTATHRQSELLRLIFLFSRA
jgi:DNA-binding CsgD family transcriptional regulator